MKNLYSTSAYREIDHKKIFKVLLNRWNWLALSILCAWATAWVYLFFTPALYTCRSSLKFEDSRSEISELLQAKNRFYRQDKIEAEKFILQSHSVRKAAVRSLSYPISFCKKEYFKTTNLYPNKPFDISILYQKEVFFSGWVEFKSIDKYHFSLSTEIDGSPYRKTIRYGAPVFLPGIKFKILQQVKPPPANTYRFKFNTQEGLVELLSKGLRIEDNENDGILHLKLTDANTRFAADALNHLALSYLQYNTAQRSASASQTIHFIDTLLDDLKKSVASAGKDLEEFKIKNNFLDLPSSAEHKAIKLAELGMEKQRLEIQAVNIGMSTTDPMLNDLIPRLNQLLSQKNELSKQYKSSSVNIINMEEQIRELKLTISNNIDMQLKKTQRSISYIDHEIEKLNKSYSTLPVIEKDFINLKTAFDVHQKILNYLSEKKLEARISKAAAIPSAHIIDKATYSSEIVSPKPKNVYTLATLAGLTMGILLIFGMRALNPYITDRETLESLTDIHIIGTICSYPIPEMSIQYPITSIWQPKTEFAESIRSIRTHLSFLATEKQSKIICITSDISGEGKSLISVNLAGAFSLLEKKVILVATDLRKSKMHQIFQTGSSKGLSDYLAGAAKTEEIIFPTMVNNLSFISSGSVPPNPGELLLTEKMKQLMQVLKKEYDMIILDTAPVGLVSDAIPLIRQSDINLFVVRARFSKHQSAAIPGRLKQDYAVDNLYLLLNDTQPDSLYNTYYSSN